MQRCSNERCQEQPIVFCRCNSQAFLFCENDYFNHTLECPCEIHDTKRLNPINLEAFNSLSNKIKEVIEEAEQIKDKFAIETGKIVQEHSQIIKKTLKANESLKKEMNSIINQCEKIIQKLSDPIINKNFYSPLEYILINDISKSAHILNEIQPPKIVETQTAQDLWEKIKLKTSFFSYLLNNYSTYSIYVRGQSCPFSVVGVNKFNEFSYTYDTIGYESRFLFVSPHEIMITGAKNPENENQCLLLDINNGQFLSKPNLNIGRYWHSFALFKGCPVVIGGNSQNEALSSVEILEFDSWKAMPSIKNARWSAGVSCLFDRIFLFGGNCQKSTIEVFYEDKNEWEEIDIEISYRISPGVIGLYGGNLLIFGGKVNELFLKDEVFKVDMASGKVSKMNSLPYCSSHPYGCYSITDNDFLQFIFTQKYSGRMTWGFEEEINFT